MAKPPRIPTQQLSSDTTKLFAVLNNESDLAVILISSSFIDACLLSLLEKKLLKSNTTDRLLGNSGILGSLRSRADLCYVLGLLPKQHYNDIVEIAEIRNRVAHHHLNLSFEDVEINTRVSKLSVYRLWLNSDLTLRDRFVLCVVHLHTWLLIWALEAERDDPVKRRNEPGVFGPEMDAK